ncbi:unnamed protein product (macronuclear) [Paramecium tetraurelia]|uniref:Uncharacterized protein n=1 Tax=Paramecium tetraurelia TaxID=5888 RepID=A0EDV1_PARTE|nr:uncharacterized protein GSPATT00025812001 [Paramecium tetraurelia]CAK93468.1 unnamed protein product [Paramecium tetraurelia]|eukprot:XP_001460865.1 hypothetical protein (macronuclear) [Paramecium tetraurelia strain d4-2]
MQLSPQSKTTFQSLFIDKTKDQISNILQYKLSYANQARQRFIKNQIDRPNSSMIQQTNEIDFSQNQYEKFRKISMNDSQLTVVTIRKPQKIMHTIELSPQITPITSFNSQRKYRQPQTSEKQTNPTLNSPENEKQFYFKQKQYRNKLQLKNSQNNNIKLNQYMKEHCSNSKGIQEFVKYQDDLDELFRDKLFQQQKELQDKIENLKMSTSKPDQQLQQSGRFQELRLQKTKKKQQL